jgi:hypothetical protein
MGLSEFVLLVDHFLRALPAWILLLCVYHQFLYPSSFSVFLLAGYAVNFLANGILRTLAKKIYALWEHRQGDVVVLPFFGRGLRPLGARSTGVFNYETSGPSSKPGFGLPSGHLQMASFYFRLLTRLMHFPSFLPPGLGAGFVTAFPLFGFCLLVFLCFQRVCILEAHTYGQVFWGMVAGVLLADSYLLFGSHMLSF